jgi:hypothetical protein
VLGETRFHEEVLEGERAAGDVGGVLEQDAVAGHQGGDGEAHDLPDGEVPRHHGQDESGGLVGHPGLCPVDLDALVGEDAGALPGVVLGRDGRLLDLALGLADRLSHLGDGQGGEMVLVLAQGLSKAVGARGPLGDRHQGPGTARGVGPCHSGLDTVRVPAFVPGGRLTG